MGLSARDRQALRLIESGLAVSDPGLASRLAVFTRLTAGELFPARENIGPRRRHGGFRGQLAWPVLWLVTAIALIAVGLAVGHGGSGWKSCALRVPACTAQAAAATRGRSR